MSLVQIDRITNTAAPYQPDGRNFKVHEYTCDGYIDGQPASGFIVKTLSGRAATHIRPGFRFDAEIDSFNGKTKYKIPSWMYKEGGPLSQPLNSATYSPPQQHQPQPAHAAATGPTHAQQPKMRLVDMLNMHNTIYGNVCMRYPDSSQETLAAITATIFIECHKQGIMPPVQQAAPPAAPPQAPPQPPPPQAYETMQDQYNPDDDNLPF